jgi:hypothetical protein
MLHTVSARQPRGMFLIICGCGVCLVSFDQYRNFA